MTESDSTICFRSRDAGSIVPSGDALISASLRTWWTSQGESVAPQAEHTCAFRRASRSVLASEKPEKGSISTRLQRRGIRFRSLRFQSIVHRGLPATA